MKNKIRNFCIIAHIDHGKSTLADRLLEYTNTIQVTGGQMLDDMDLEKERGITIKSHAIQMEYTYKGEKYILNLIDTPGHVDFSYEVSRSIAACEGALLIVDASQGVQAQTISNLYMAIEHDLEIIPVINKCDMASAMPEEVEDEIVELLGCKRSEIIRASGKTGMGVEEILAAVIERIPHPEGDEEAPLQALIFDSVFNSFRGIIAYFKIVNGVIRKGDKVKFFNTGKEYDADEIGVLKMEMVARQELRTGDVGYIISGIKTSKEVKVGDTITHIARPCKEAIAGFEEVKPMVFAGVYPIEAEDFEDLRSSLEKLQLNDASLTFQPESSLALGFGFRCGFLGLLHMEIVQERLDREFDMNVITTVPNVSYNIYDKQGHMTEVLLAGPCLAAQHGSHRPLPHAAGQVVGQLLRHLAAFIGNGVAVAGQGDQRLLCDIVQTGANLKIVDKGFLHQGVLDLLPGNGTGVFHQIAQQQPDLGAAGQAAGTDTGGKSIIGAHRSLHPPCAFTWYQRPAPLPKGRAAGRQKLFLLV